MKESFWLKASYSVEGAAIISICLMLTGSAILMGYDIYREAYEYVDDSEDNLNVVKLFKVKQSISNIVEEIKK